MSYKAEIKDYKGKDAIYMTAGKYTAIVAPFNGSNLQEMRDVENDIEFFRKDDSFTAEDLKGFAEVYGFPTLLFPNRLEDGVLKCTDYTYTFPITDVEGNNHLHGFLHLREHTIVSVESTADSAIAKTEYVYDENDPFFSTFPVKLKAEFTFTLKDDGMSYEFTVTNLSDRQLPYGVCNHTAMNGPFTSTGEPLDTRLYVTIGAKWLLNDRGNPTGDTIPLDNHDKQYQTGSMIPVKHKLDNDVYNMDTDEVDGRPFRGAIVTDIATGKKIFYEVDDNFNFWVLWNDGGEKGFFCPEPMTWMINAPNLPLSFAESGYLELAPGQSKTVYEHIYSTK